MAYIIAGIIFSILMGALFFQNTILWFFGSMAVIIGQINTGFFSQIPPLVLWMFAGIMFGLCIAFIISIINFKK